MTQVSAGILRERVTIQSRATATGTRGQSTDVWTNVDTRYAQVVNLSGTEREQARKIVENAAFEITMRKPKTFRLTTSHRISWRSEIYGIGAVIEDGDKLDDVRCLCSKGEQ